MMCIHSFLLACLCNIKIKIGKCQMIMIRGDIHTNIPTLKAQQGGDAKQNKVSFVWLIAP
jgi:hypothetical protein